MCSESKIEKVLKPIVVKLHNFLKDDMKIPVIEEMEIKNVKHLLLKDNTVMIGTGGDIQIIIIVGYDEKLLDKLVDSFLYGEKVDEDELFEIQESVCCEVANTVVGNAIRNPYGNSLISITPPILIHEAKSLAKYKNSTIMVSVIKTEYGEIQLSGIGPKELFVDSLDFKEL